MTEKPAKPKTNYAYRPQYGVVVICQSEAEQQKIYESLQKEGYTLKVVSV